MGFIFFWSRLLKFLFSKKATKNDKTFTVDMTLTTWRQIDDEDFVKFFGLLRKDGLYEQKSGVILISTEPNIFRMMFHHKIKKVWCCKPPVPLVGQKACSLLEILTWLVVTENTFSHVFSNKQPCQYFLEVQEVYNIIIFWFLMEKYLVPWMLKSPLTSIAPHLEF